MATLPLYAYEPDPTKPVPVIFEDVTANVDAQSCATSPVQSQVHTNRPILY